MDQYSDALLPSLLLLLMGQFKVDLRFLSPPAPPSLPRLPVHLMGQYSDALLPSFSLYLMGQFKGDLSCCAVIYLTDIVVSSPGTSVDRCDIVPSYLPYCAVLCF